MRDSAAPDPSLPEGDGLSNRHKRSSPTALGWILWRRGAKLDGWRDL